MRITNLTLALFTFFSTYAYACANEACDILASLEADPSSVATPVAFNDINSSAVIYACSKAILRNDEHKPRFLLHRARGYLKGGESDKALFDLEQSHNLGYPAATFGLATAYFLGDDVAQDLGKARQLFIDSFEHGVSWSALGLSMLYRNEMYEDYDIEKAKKWEAKFKVEY